jgi:hypothetical protein
MDKRLVYFIIIILLLLNAHPIYSQYYYYNERPQEPSFPNISNRLRALGEDFSGIISDLESDALQNPSLATLLESKSIGITFLPYYCNYYSSYFPPTLLTLLLPNFPVSKLAIGFQNQLVCTKSGYFETYANTNYYYDEFYSRQYSYISYQQLFFLAFTPSEHFSIAPFYILTKSPYQEQYSEDWGRNENTTYAASGNLSGQYDDNILFHQFGIGTTFNSQPNSFQITVAFKTGDNKTKLDDEAYHTMFDISSYTYEYDSSYDIYQYWRYSNETDTRNIDKTKKVNELNVSFRWQKEIDDDNTFNTLVRFTRSSTALTGSELGNSYDAAIDSSIHRWRNDPYPESSEVNVYTDIDGNKDSSNIKGTINSFNLILGLGYETRLNRRLNGFIGAKSILGLASDTSSKLGIKITTIDTLTDTTGISGSQLVKSKSFSIALPLGLEYKPLPSLTIRTGLTPKVSYDKSGLATHNQIVNVKGVLLYSFGVGYIFRDKFSIDTYNYGNLGSLNNWNIQFKYIF